jgi:hypothetical protein
MEVVVVVVIPAVVEGEREERKTLVLVEVGARKTGRGPRPLSPPTPQTQKTLASAVRGQGTLHNRTVSVVAA